MKKILALVLAFAFMFTVCFTATADTLTDGFDTDTVTDTVLRNANVVLNDTVTLTPGSAAGKYNVLYKGQDMGTQLYICHQTAEGKSSEEGPKNHIAVSLTYPANTTTTDAFLYFWAAIGGAALQYISGAEEMGTYPNELYSNTIAAAQRPDHTLVFSLNGYAVKVIAMAHNGTVVVGLVIDIPGLY